MAVEHIPQLCLELVHMGGLVDRLAVLQPVGVDWDIPHDGGDAAGQRLQHHDALGLLMAQKGEGVRPAVGVAEVLRPHIPRKQDVAGGCLHGFADLVGQKGLVGLAEPDEPHLRHPAGQLHKVGQALAHHPVPHRDDALLAFGQAVPLPEAGPAGRVRVEEPGVDPVGEGVDGLADLVPHQDAPGVDAGRDDHIPLPVAEDQPPLEQGRQQVGAEKAVAEVLHGGMAVIDHLAPPGMGPGRRQRRAGQDGVQVDHALFGLRAGRRDLVDQGQARAFQGGGLVFQRLAHPAFAHHLIAAPVNADRH